MRRYSSLINFNPSGNNYLLKSKKNGKFLPSLPMMILDMAVTKPLTYDEEDWKNQLVCHKRALSGANKRNPTRKFKPCTQ